MKILTIDIETAPAKVYSFRIGRNVFIGTHMVIESDRMLCFGAKWNDEKGVMFFSEWGDGREGMIRAAHALLEEADAVCTYNGDNFDLPFINREIDLYNVDAEPDDRLFELPEIPSVDLYKVYKKNERWLSHKLGWIAEQLGLGSKLETDFQLWLDVMAGDPKAQRRMERYCKRDVSLTERMMIGAWAKIHNLPIPITFEGEEIRCTCGSTSVQRRGFRRTKTRVHQRFQCQDCGHWWKKRLSERGEAAEITS